MSLSLVVIAMLLLPSGEEDAVARARAVEDARRSLSQSIAAANAAPEALRAEATDDARMQLDQPMDCFTLEDLARASTEIERKGAAALYALGAATALESESDRRDREHLLAAAFLAAGFAEEAGLAGIETGTTSGHTIARLAALAIAPAGVAPLRQRCGVFDGFSERVGAHARGESQLTDEDWKLFSMLPVRLRFEIADALASAALERGDMQDAGAIRRTALADAPRPATTATPARLIDALESDDETALAALSEIAAQPGAMQSHALEALADRFDKLSPPAQAALADDLSDAAARPAPAHERSDLDRSRLRIIEHGLAADKFADRVKALSDLAKHPEYYAQLPAPLRKNAIADLQQLGAREALLLLGEDESIRSRKVAHASVEPRIRVTAVAPAGANLGEAGAFTASVAEELVLIKAELQK
jgi:hypothetical protein